MTDEDLKEMYGRNPYFIGINSAMICITVDIRNINSSQSLFYWN